MHTDHLYIEALKNNDSRLLNELYKKFAPPVKQYLLSKGADEAVAGDIFQEALIDIYKMASEKDFVLTCPFEAFVLLVCKRKWINITKKNKSRGVTNSLDDGYTHIKADDLESANLLAARVEKESMVMQLLNEISERCKEIILASYVSQSQEALAKELGVSYAYLRKKKSVCMSELIALVHDRQKNEP